MRGASVVGQTDILQQRRSANLKAATSEQFLGVGMGVEGLAAARSISFKVSVKEQSRDMLTFL